MSRSLRWKHLIMKMTKLWNIDYLQIIMMVSKGANPKGDQDLKKWVKNRKKRRKKGNSKKKGKIM